MNVGIFTVGVVIQCCTIVAGPACLIAGRFVTGKYSSIMQAEICLLTQSAGLGIGAISVNVPNYNAEVAPPEIRGGLVALQQLAITAGIMASLSLSH